MENTKKLTKLALLTAVAIVLSIAESWLPPLAPIVGMKIGIANIITLVTLIWYGSKEALAVLFTRILLSSIYGGQMVSLAYSLAGGFCCFIVMSILYRFIKEIWVVSVFGALAHNIGQVIMAMIITSTWEVVSYLLILEIVALITGTLTGLVATRVIKHNFVKVSSKS